MILSLGRLPITDPFSQFRDDRSRRDEPFPHRQQVRGVGRARRCVRSLAPRSEQEQAEQARIDEHLAYLKRMAADGVVAPELAARARVVWWVAWISAGGRLPVPAAATFSGGPVEYHWTVGPHQLSAEVPATGLCHWFYRNTTTGEVWGAEVPADDGFPPRWNITCSESWRVTGDVARRSVAHPARSRPGRFSRAGRQSGTPDGERPGVRCPESGVPTPGPGGEALPSFFQLSSEDEKQPVPRLSVWVEGLTTSCPSLGSRRRPTEPTVGPAAGSGSGSRYPHDSRLGFACDPTARSSVGASEGFRHRAGNGSPKRGPGTRGMRGSPT